MSQWTLSLALLALAPASALAAGPFSTAVQGVIGPVAGHAVLANGAAAPSVEWSGAAGIFAMAFETEVAAAPGCTNSYAIGMAWSADGTTWDVLGDFALAPTAGTPWACGARNPALIELDGKWGLWFDALGDPTDPAAIGAALIVGSNVSAAELQPTLAGLSEPTVVHMGGAFVLAAVDGLGDIVVSRSLDGRTWMPDSAAAITVGTSSWNLDGLYNPALTCIEVPDYPYELFYGGWTGADRAWTYGVSTDAAFWFIAPTLDEWLAGGGWDTWDVLGSGSTTLAWYSDRSDPTGLPAIHFASDGLDTPGLRQGKRCSAP